MAGSGSHIQWSTIVMSSTDCFRSLVILNIIWYCHVLQSVKQFVKQQHSLLYSVISSLAPYPKYVWCRRGARPVGGWGDWCWSGNHSTKAPLDNYSAGRFINGKLASRAYILALWKSPVGRWVGRRWPGSPIITIQNKAIDTSQLQGIPHPRPYQYNVWTISPCTS